MAALWYVITGKPKPEPAATVLPTIAVEPVRPSLNTADLFGFGHGDEGPKPNFNKLSVENQKNVMSAPKLAQSAMVRGGAIAIVGTGVLTAVTLIALDIRSMEELGNQVGRQKVGKYLKPVADIAEHYVKENNVWLRECAALAAPSVKHVEEWANAKKAESGGDIAHMLGVSGSVKWLRDYATAARERSGKLISKSSNVSAEGQG